MSETTFTRRQMLSLLLASSASASLPWAGPALAQDIKRGGTLHLALEGTPRHLNGAVQSGWATGLPSTQLFASPLKYDDQWKPQPYLAESWALASDGKSLTLTLRRNAVFHDGQPVTSEDVAFSIMQIKANHPFQSMLQPVETVETPDPHTAIIRMTVPHPAIELAMSPALCPILPKHIYGDGQDLKSHPRNSEGVVGSGPFKLARFEPGKEIVLQRFEQFFLPGKPYLDRLVISLVSDAMTGTLLLERGDAQMIPFASKAIDLKRLEANPAITLFDKGYEGFGGVTWLAMNLSRKPMSDIAVRKAMATAIDKKFIANALQGGFASPIDGPLSPENPFATEEVVHYAHDAKKAAQMLDAAGYTADADGVRFSIVMDFFPGAEWARTGAEYLRTQLKKVGIQVQIRTSPDFGTWSRRMAEHDFDVSMDGTFGWGDPVIGVHRTYLSSNIKPIVWANTQSYANPRVDELLEQAARAADPGQRRAAYAEFQKIVTDELPVIYLTTQPFRTAARTTVGNVPQSIWGPLSPYDEVYLKS